jgi:hypothetical protein
MNFNDQILFSGGINVDDEDRAIPKGDYRDFSYCRLGNTSEQGFTVVTSQGTLLINNSSITQYDTIVGAVAWLKKNAIVYFVYNIDSDHQIWMYNISSQTHQLILTSSELNLSPQYPIYHANIIDDILKWTDGRWDPDMYDADGNRLFNPPFQINLQKAIDGDYSSYSLQTIDAVKWPLDPPRVSYFTDSSRNDNKLRNKLFKFIIQPIYENGEVGVWSMYSNLELPQQSELVSGTNWIFPNNSNGINIQFETGPSIIRKFNIAVQQFDKDSLGVEPPFGIFIQLDKDQDNIPSNSIHVVPFYGGVSTVPATDVFKNYDRLPVVADCQEYLPTNQLVYTNFREGYDKPTEAPFILDVEVDYQLNEINWKPLPDSIRGVLETDPTIFAPGTPMAFYVQDVLYEYQWNLSFGFAEGDTFSATVSTFGTWTYVLTYQDIYNALLNVTEADQNAYIIQLLGDNMTDFFGIPNGFISYFFASGDNLIYYACSNPLFFPANTVFGPPSGNVQTNAAPSLKAGATHEFGIVYGDRAYRDSTVYTIDSMNLFVPWFYDIPRDTLLSNQDNPFTINPRFTINHIPPVWATKYWIVAKPATEIQSFGQYTTNNNQLDAPDGAAYVSSIKLDDVSTNRYIIYLDRYYTTKNIGATIRHEIKVGDKLRFVRKRPGGDLTSPNSVPYCPYVELDVIGYDPVGGNDERQAVYVNIFDYQLIETDINSVFGELFGQLLEVYTPRPSTDDTGNIFVSTWRDVSEAIDIRNPHTDNRAHGAPPLYYVYVFGSGPYKYAMNGDYTFLEGNFYEITIHNLDGTTTSAGSSVTFASYDQNSNQTTLGFGFSPTSNVAYLTIDTDPSAAQTNVYQVSNDLNSSRAAAFSLGYGDVYVRRRNYQTGLNAESSSIYYYIEDSNYSDYWPSNIHEIGRTRIEDQNAKMTHRQATAIHSDSFIVGTQINGLSSFSLLNDNIEDMNPFYGPVVRTYMSGREGKTLKCIQPRKENSIYIQFYPNEVGSDSTVRVSNRTFASWFDYKSLYGCQEPGATAQLPTGDSVYFDSINGAFILSGGNGQRVISEADPDTGINYKFRTKTKQLANQYNETLNPLVRTYVNEKMGEVGFAFRLGNQYIYNTISVFNPLSGFNYWTIAGDVSFLLGYEVQILQPNQNYFSQVTEASYDPERDSTIIELFGIPGPLVNGIEGVLTTVSGFTYEHVVFDYINDRWRSTYNYNFSNFANLGQTLVGFGANNQLYLHNQNSITFHGENFLQKIKFVSNEQPISVKRYQAITQFANKTFDVLAYSDPNQSYIKGMQTYMPTNIITVYEGYSRVNYRKNVYDPRYLNDTNTCESSYDPPTDNVNGWTFPGDESILGPTVDLEYTTITIIQSDGKAYTGRVGAAVYDSISDTTKVTIIGQAPDSNGISGEWYYSDIAMWNGEDVRADALTHEITYDPTIDQEGSVLFSVGIQGVLS